MSPGGSLLLWLLWSPSRAVQVLNLRTEYLESPIGIDVPQPRFSWQTTSDAALRGLAQQSYRLDVFEVGGGSSPVWSSLEVASSVAHNVKYGVGGSQAAALKSGASYTWQVRVSSGGVSQQSSRASFSMGMLDKNAWTGKFIGATSRYSNQVAPWIRKTFSLPAGPLTGSALLFVASVGFCEVSVNGKAASEAVLSPSISYLPSRVLYRTYNVTGLLHADGANNTIGLWASAGWADYASFLNGKWWQNAPLVMAELQIDRRVVAASDETWQCRRSDIGR